jgi:hypothetical protein
MRLFKRETKLERLQKELQMVDQEINELQTELKQLKEGPLDPVLNRFLKLHFCFDYETEKATLERRIMQTEWFLRQAEKEKAQLEPRIREESFKEECKRRGIKFIGKDVDGYEFSTVKIHCSHCGHKFSVDLRGHGSWNNIWCCSTDVALQQIYAMKYNKVWPLQCEKCHAELDVWVLREKL